MTFQEQLDAMIPAEKKAEAAVVFEAMTSTFKRYDADINEMKQRVRSVEGIKPEDHARLEARARELEEKSSLTEGEYKKLLKMRDELTAKNAELGQKLTATSIEKEVRKAMGALKIVPEAVDAVYDLVASKVVVGEDGEFTVLYKDKDGKELKSSVGDYLTKEWAVTPLAKRLLVADFSTGGGANGTAGGVSATKKWGDMSLGEQSVLFRQNPEIARQLMAAKK